MEQKSKRSSEFDYGPPGENISPMTDAILILLMACGWSTGSPDCGVSRIKKQISNVLLNQINPFTTYLKLAVDLILFGKFQGELTANCKKWKDHSYVKALGEAVLDMIEKPCIQTHIYWLQWFNDRGATGLAGLFNTCCLLAGFDNINDTK